MRSRDPRQMSLLPPEPGPEVGPEVAPLPSQTARYQAVNQQLGSTAESCATIEPSYGSSGEEPGQVGTVWKGERWTPCLALPMTGDYATDLAIQIRRDLAALRDWPDAFIEERVVKYRAELERRG